MMSFLIQPPHPISESTFASASLPHRLRTAYAHGREQQQQQQRPQQQHQDKLTHPYAMSSLTRLHRLSDKHLHFCLPALQKTALEFRPPSFSKSQGLFSPLQARRHGQATSHNQEAITADIGHCCCLFCSFFPSLRSWIRSLFYKISC